MVNQPLGADEAFQKSDTAYKDAFSSKESKKEEKADASKANKASEVVPIKEDEKEVSKGKKRKDKAKKKDKEKKTEKSNEKYKEKEEKEKDKGKEKEKEPEKSEKEKEEPEKSSVDAKPGVSGVSGKPKSTAIVAAVEVTGFADSDRHHASYTFDESAFKAFTAANGYTHIIRSGYVPVEGFDLRFDNACISVFSCSNFLQQYAVVVGGKSEEEGKKELANMCTAAFIDGSNCRIRMMEFNTSGKLDKPPPPSEKKKAPSGKSSSGKGAPPPAPKAAAPKAGGAGGQAPRPGAPQPAKPKPVAAPPKKAAPRPPSK